MDAPVPRHAVTWADVAALESALATELPGFRVAYKDESRVQRALGLLVRPFNRTYLSQYTTVIGRTVYFPSRTWREAAGPEAIYTILRHEAVHLRDARRFPVLFELSYVGVLPVGLTLRALWEWRGYAESLRVHAELHGVIPDALLDHVAQRFTGPDYLWMAPFPALVRARLERLRQDILAEVRSS